MSKEKCLVTGGCGFIGANLIRELVRGGRVEIVALDDLSGGFRENLPAGTEFVQGSITDNGLIERLFTEHKFKYVYHLAAYAAEGLSHFIRRYNYTNNVIGSINLINAAVNHGVECFVFTSSIAVYGAGQVPMKEDVMPCPEDPYGVAKLAVELDLKAAHEMFGLDYVIFRPHNVYGEYQNIGDKYRNVVGIFMNQILQGRPMSIFGDGEQQRAFSYIGDLVGPIANSPWITGARNEIFNIGADVPYSVNTLAGEVAKAMGARGHAITHLAARKEVQLAYSDHAKATRIFGEGSKTSLPEGLARMAAWVKLTGARSSVRYKDIEVLKNMPPSWLQ